MNPGGIKGWKKKKMLKGRLLPPTGLLPCEHQPFAPCLQTTSAADICQNVFSLLTCSFTPSLSRRTTLLIRVLRCDWNGARQARGCWGERCSHSRALMEPAPKEATAAPGTRVMARTPFFPNTFLWQKTEKGFHRGVKMAISLLVTPAERWGALMGDHFLLYVFLFHCHFLFHPLWMWKTND